MQEPSVAMSAAATTTSTTTVSTTPAKAPATYMDLLPLELSTRIRYKACLSELVDKVPKDNDAALLRSIKCLFGTLKKRLTRPVFKRHFDFPNSTKYNSTRAYESLWYNTITSPNHLCLNDDDMSEFVERLATFYEHKLCVVFVDVSDFRFHGFCEDSGDVYYNDELDEPTVSGASRPPFSHEALKRFLECYDLM